MYNALSACIYIIRYTYICFAQGYSIYMGRVINNCVYYIFYTYLSHKQTYILGFLILNCYDYTFFIYFFNLMPVIYSLLLYRYIFNIHIYYEFNCRRRHYPENNHFVSPTPKQRERSCVIRVFI